jgi:ligand-binding SRPBCC domain-containing protein
MLRSGLGQTPEADGGSPAPPPSIRLTQAPGGLFTLEARLWLPHPPEQVFPFFADAFNLQTITPPWLNFEVLTPPPIQMRAGLKIDYRLRLHGLPLRWQSDITAWEPPARFVDEQRRGPYRTWIHEHTFIDHNGGTLAADRVRYTVFGGRLINALFVRRDVAAIFHFRQLKLAQLFPSPIAPP